MFNRGAVRAGGGREPQQPAARAQTLKLTKTERGFPFPLAGYPEHARFKAFRAGE